MAFYTIKKLPILTYDKRFAGVDKPFLESLSAHESIMLGIISYDGKMSKNKLKLQEGRIDALVKDFNALPRKDFISKWVQFDFVDKEAQNMSWEIISDCLILNKIGFIKDKRDLAEKLTDDMSGKDYLYPQGEIVDVVLSLKSTSVFAHLFNKPATLSLQLHLNKISRIVGSLSEWEVLTPHYLLKIGRDVSIHPV